MTECQSTSSSLTLNKEIDRADFRKPVTPSRGGTSPKSMTNVYWRLESLLHFRRIRVFLPPEYSIIPSMHITSRTYLESPISPHNMTRRKYVVSLEELE